VGAARAGIPAELVALRFPFLTAGFRRFLAMVDYSRVV
jgi:hypothetical protein